VNYDSEGDCGHPTDKAWTWLQLTHRGTSEAVQITSHGTHWNVPGDDPVAARTAMLLSKRRSSGAVDPPPRDRVGAWNHSEAMARAARVAEEFASPKLKAFDSHLFWGSWKWIGWFATDFTWVGSWIMLSVLKAGKRGAPLCIDWLRFGAAAAAQSSALRQALHELTGESFELDRERVNWYDSGLSGKGAKTLYPEPDLLAWLGEPKAEYGG
jgi:hypothetical protein